MRVFSRTLAAGLVSLLLTGLTSCGATEDDALTPAPIPVPAASNVSSLPALAAQNVVLYEVFVADFSVPGAFDGMLTRLDSLKDTRVNTLWLMPIHPTHGSPYAVDSYTAVNPDFGDLAAFDRLVVAAHKRGLHVLLDWVANHTSYYHPWILAHPDWYNHDANGQIVHPQPAWTDVADLNYNQPALRQEMTSSMSTWVTQHAVDGFRCDAADLVPADFWQQAISTLHQANPNLLLLAEGSNTSHYGAGFALTFGWDFYTAMQSVFIRNASVAGLPVAHAQEMQQVPAGAYRLRFTTNHDEVQAGTPAAQLGSEAAARAAYVATLAFGATPLLYNGQEAGDPAQLTNPVRTPIRWGLDPTAGTFYRRLLRLYQAQPAWRAGPAEWFAQSPNAVVVRHRLNGQEVAILVNVRSYAITLTPPAAWAGGAGWVDAFSQQPAQPAQPLALPAYGYAIWLR
ncbi:MAG: alpha-amylase family glycosyl hydrolase [Janthinobacterium lividum]